MLMLLQIHIRNLVTIEEVHIHLNHGCMMVTGETGAGKSIFIEAIELALGGRSRTDIIRAGKDRADISLCFDLSNLSHIVEWLKNHDMSYEECMIRRTITHDGRSKSYINDFPVTLQTVRELSELLFHLHGQYEQHTLFKSETQREMLDRYAGHLSLLSELKEAALAWQSVTKSIKTIQSQTHDCQERKAFLQFQYHELEQTKIQKDEWQKLEALHHTLSHQEALLQHIQHCLSLLTDDEKHNILSRLNELRKHLEAISRCDQSKETWIKNLDTIIISLTDLETEWRHDLENRECDPSYFQQIEERLSLLFNLARKHQVSPDKLFGFKEHMLEELNILDASDATLKELITKQTALEEHYISLAKEVTKNRMAAAILFSHDVTKTIQSLSLPHGEFHIDVSSETHEILSPYGQDKIIFQIKTNPEQSFKPIEKAISGGELSRLSLSVHLALTEHMPTPILIFDEVDTGIGGAIAQKLGKLLRKLGETYQVFCITHQAQVASCGHHHLLVEKEIIGNITYSRLRLLNAKEKTQEIARMLGGEKITKKTLEHAREVLENV